MDFKVNIDNESGIYTIDQTLRILSNDQESSFQKWKSLGIAMFFVSLALWLMILILAIIGIIPLTQLIVGSLHKNECPMNHLIPIYLIIAGVVGLLLVFIQIFQSFSPDRCTVLVICLLVVLVLFGFAWFIAGNVWVFRAKSIVQFNDPYATSSYCNKTVFYCAYVTIIISYIFAILGPCCQGFRPRP